MDFADKSWHLKSVVFPVLKSNNDANNFEQPWKWQLNIGDFNGFDDLDIIKNSFISLWDNLNQLWTFFRPENSIVVTFKYMLI